MNSKSRSSLGRDNYRSYYDYPRNNYHHYSTARQSQFLDSNTIVIACATAALIYHTLRHYGLLSISFSEAVWHAFIALLPIRVVRRLSRAIKLDQPVADLALSDGLSSPNFTERHLAKSTIMLRYLGIGINSFPKVRELSQLHSQLVTGPRSSEPPGLGNWDNSCYQNSIIHGLAALPALSEYLSRNLHHLAGRSEFRTHRALKDITDSLNDPRNKGCALWIPNELKSMSSWQQQDAQEYFSKIVEAIERESKQALVGFTTNPGLRLDRPSIFSDKGDSFTSSSSPSPSSSSSENIICSLRNPLEGLLAQRVGCTQCGWCEEISLIPFNCLTVSLGRRPDNDIQQCLDEYTDLERIEGVECAKCTLLKRKTQLHELVKKFSNSNNSPAKTPPLSSPSTSTSSASASAASSSAPDQTAKDYTALQNAALEKIRVIDELLESGDLSDTALTKKCAIPRSARVQSTKTRQGVIARPPKSLVMHVNRSVFDERSGLLVKNSSPLRFPKSMDITEWCLGAQALNEGRDKDEVWAMDPAQSLLPVETQRNTAFGRYELQAVICHFGRHETGHYVCFRKFSTDKFPFDQVENDDENEVDDEKVEQPKERWFRLSDEKVSPVSEGYVLAQGGAFMLFYEAVHDDDTGENGPDARESAPAVNGHNISQASQKDSTRIEVSDRSERITVTTNGPALSSNGIPTSGAAAGTFNGDADAHQEEISQ